MQKRTPMNKKWMLNYLLRQGWKVSKDWHQGIIWLYWDPTNQGYMSHYVSLMWDEKSYNLELNSRNLLEPWFHFKAYWGSYDKKALDGLPLVAEKLEQLWKQKLDGDIKA